MATHVVIPTKNTGLALLLTILFGPLGMLYATIPGAVVMLFLTVVAVLLTAGPGLLLTWPVSLIWTAMAVSSHNRKLLEA